MRIRWRYWNRVLHRDIGYLCVGMTLIYALSGIALNHIDDWNPSYTVTRTAVQWPDVPDEDRISRDAVLAFLDRIGETALSLIHI